MVDQLFLVCIMYTTFLNTYKYIHFVGTSKERKRGNSFLEGDEFYFHKMYSMQCCVMVHISINKLDSLSKFNYVINCGNYDFFYIF